ncbi:PadR family transcriptional regulator [Lottiidibacillus patelloidae]|nr:PadR family transcriptional regulator [Lottiidibacillus patelloidae]
MSLRYALLGLLGEQPYTGYELKQRFQMKMVHFWNAHHTQIYRELNKMEQEGLVTAEIVKQDENPDKKVYTLQEKGKSVLTTWLLNKEVSPPKIKDEMLLRVSLFQFIPEEEAIGFLQESKAHHEQVLNHITMWKEETYNEEVMEERIGEYLTTEYGLLYMKNWITWCDWAIEKLEKRQEKK